MLELFCGAPLEKRRLIIGVSCTAASTIFFLLASYAVFDEGEIHDYLLLLSDYKSTALRIRFTFFAITIVGILASFLLVAGLFTVIKH